MSKDTKKTKSLTVFKSDRHEDIAAICLAAIVVACTLLYMAFLTPTVTVMADADGTLVSILVEKNQEVKKGDPIYLLSVTKTVWSRDAAGQEHSEQVTEEKTIKAKASGTIIAILAEENTTTKRSKTPIIELHHKKGTLP